MELKEGQKVDVGVSPKTSRGHVGGIETGSGRWTSSDESVATVTVDPADELKATVEGVDGSNNESVNIEFRADGKPGEGVREIVASGSVVVTQGDATVAELTFGEATDEPTPDPAPEPDPEPLPEPAPETPETPGDGETPVEPTDG